MMEYNWQRLVGWQTAITNKQTPTAAKPSVAVTAVTGITQNIHSMVGPEAAKTEPSGYPDANCSVEQKGNQHANSATGR
jgi:hypothetical protein